MTETDVLQECRLAASECGATMHRNNRGAYKDKNGRFIRYGVGDPGGSDLVGWTKDGLFCALEIKIPDWVPRNAADKKRYEEQLNFIEQVRKAGGIAGVCRCRQDVIDLLTHPK